MIETITFARKGDKTVICGDWPEEVEFSRELLNEAWPMIRREGHYVEVSVYNGCAWYWIDVEVGRIGSDQVDVLHARLVNCFIGFDP